MRGYTSFGEGGYCTILYGSWGVRVALLSGQLLFTFVEILLSSFGGHGDPACTQPP